MLNSVKKKSEGFTIIEVLIVLAIAGLILLIVFLAVPALQRNARNTTIKNDAASLASGFSEYASNNNGQQPASISSTTSGTITIGASGSAQSTVKTNGATAINIAKLKPTTFKASTLYWQVGTACDGTVSTRAIVVYYYVENGGGSGALQCVDG